MKVEWIVNEDAELGVLVDGECFFLYKGDSIIYKEDMKIRTVGKREFGECCHPLNYRDLTQVGTVSLDDCDRWVNKGVSTHPDAI